MGDICSIQIPPDEYETYLSLQKLDDYLTKYQSMPSDLFNKYSIIKHNDSDRLHFQKIFRKMILNKTFSAQLLQIENVQVERSIASMLGLAICDALGASTQFLYFKKKGYNIIKEGFRDIKVAVRTKVLDSRAGTVGVWTDDCSMALCIATSLIYNNNQFIPKHIRYLFNLWWYNGLYNGGRQRSIGLGGNISISMKQFIKSPRDYCATGDRFNNGNGSLMRLAPIPILYRKDQAKAELYSGYSSLTTHNGQQAQQCCKLLAKILIALYNRPKEADPKTTLDQACKRFHTKCRSVYCLANSLQQPQDSYQNMCNKYGKRYSQLNKSVADRNWKWKQQQFTYSRTRLQLKPGYVGSYCMDGLAMALHTVWHTNSFEQLAILNADMGGDCDSVGAIAGQIAGAIYGIDDEMIKLYSEMQDFKEGRFEVFLHGYKLAKAAAAL